MDRYQKSISVFCLFSSLCFANDEEDLNSDDPVCTRTFRYVDYACADGAVSLGGTYHGGGHREDDLFLSHGDVYVGTAKDRVSLHFDGVITNRDYYQTSKKVGSSDLYTRMAAIRFGDPTIDRIQIVAGRVEPAFGLNATPVTPLFREVEPSYLWSGPKNGGTIIWDNQKQYRVETSLTSEISEGKRRQAVGLRSMLDISELGGVRLFFSGYAHDTGERRYGFAMFNPTPRGDINQIEFVRSRARPDGKKSDFDQLIRIGYRSSFRGSAAWRIQYDDMRRHYRHFILQHTVALKKIVHLHLGPAYLKSEREGFLTRWYFALATEVKL